MRKLTVALLTAAILAGVILCLSGCVGNTSNEYESPDLITEKPQTAVSDLLLGSWTLQSQTYADDGERSEFLLSTLKFYSDGTVAVNNDMGTWKIVDNELMILGNYSGQFWNADSIVGKFECDGQRLEFFGAQVDCKDNSVNLVYSKTD